MNQIEINRHFAVDGDPYTSVVWEERTARITNFKGDVLFEQQNVRVPADWSVTATNIVVSKYFYGKLGSPERETGVDQLVKRVVNTIVRSAIAQGYFDKVNASIFAGELAYMLLHQIGAFNSPVWFNVGCDQYEPDAKASSWHWTDSGPGSVAYSASGYKNPQCSACFINSIEDSMEGIMDLARTEALLFKFGSGTGTNFSPLRSSKEAVSGGGVASGPLSFMKGFDAFAGVIKSGGKTRRAAKMAILNVDHPDIEAFIDCKLLEDKKAQALMREGYDGTSGPDSPAYASVFYQNANNSVRASDEFMRAVEVHEAHTTYDRKGNPIEILDADKLMHKIAQATWECGDPGIQFDDTINKWHTCKTSGRINASNPCSEYMFLDNSACNLASLNLMKFLKPNGTFDVQSYEQAITLFTIAQDILVDLSGYPTEQIAKNSHDYRPLGLGYANLGALLMVLGLPYDSDDGRSYAAVLTAIMTGRAYATSAFLAEHLTPIQPATRSLTTGETGACPGWFANKESFLDVIRMHEKALDYINRDVISDELFMAATLNWRTANENGSRFGFRNAQVTVLAPTGTIGFMMDCDTTGIEPELALVKYKKLVGGGQLKIVNETVECALMRLDYSKLTIDLLLKHIDKHGSLEDSRILLDEHLPVFDTAFKPAEGSRFIHYLGHIKMMAAVQPFLSGAISKTVNMPNQATVEEIEQAYLQAWHLGLKSVAIYRDGSKSNQVLVTSKEDKKQPATGLLNESEFRAVLARVDPAVLQSPLVLSILSDLGMKSCQVHDEVAFVVPVDDLQAPPRAVRHRLPDTRSALTHKFTIAGHEGYLTVGMYEHGQPGEIFIAMAKEGSTISGFMDSIAMVFSIALQHGVPLETLIGKLAHTRFEPSGWTGNPDIGYAKSIMDYVARWLEHQFLKSQQGKLFPEQTTPELVIEDQASQTGGAVQAMSAVMSMTDGPACQVCGCIMVRSGTCYKCLECGGSSGCS